MKKSVFYYFFAALFAVTMFASCSDDDDVAPLPPIDEEIAGNYGGKLDIAIGSTSVSGDGIAQNVTVTKAGDAAISLSIADFSFATINVGDINLNNCPLTSTGENSYSFTASPFELTSEDGTLTCTVTLNSGTIVNGTLTLDLGISAVLAGTEQNVSVTFTGVRGQTAETESSEAAITSFSFETSEEYPMNKFVVAGSVSIDEENHTVSFNVDKDSVDAHTDALANLCPTFTVSEGATADKTSGAVMDFSGEGNSVVITVTAEDGTAVEWTVKANLVIVPTTFMYTFDEEWQAVSDDDNAPEKTWLSPSPVDVWASANKGVQALKDMMSYEGDFAMTQETPGYGGSGHAVKLTTLRTKGLAFLTFKAPAVTPGTLFTGSFNYNMLAGMSKDGQLGMTHFVKEHKGKPVRFKGVYKYKKGSNYIDGSSATGLCSTWKPEEWPENLSIDDKGLIIAVLFDASSIEYLDGTNLLNAENHVMKAVVGGDDYVADTNGEWVSFDIPFEEVGTYDSTKQYKLAVVCQSSQNGGNFCGAEGSELIVDNLEVVAE